LFSANRVCILRRITQNKNLAIGYTHEMQIIEIIETSTSPSISHRNYHQSISDWKKKKSDDILNMIDIEQCTEWNRLHK